jgi:nucleosome binding factor SPN SPT16 subunit
VGKEYSVEFLCCCRSPDTKHAQRVSQDIKMLRSAVSVRDKERAERATLVAQEKLIQGRSLLCVAQQKLV